MKRKIIIATTIFTMVLCLSFLGYGVYAYLNQSFTISNIIGFKPSTQVGIYVGLDCSVSGIKQMQTSEIPDGYQSLQDYYIDKGFINKLEFNQQDKIDNKPQVLPDWTISESLHFINEETPIEYTIKVYNYSNSAILVSISEYVKDDTYFINSTSESVRIEGLKVGENPSFGTIKLTTHISKKSHGFNKIPNNFKVLLETVV